MNDSHFGIICGLILGTAFGFIVGLLFILNDTTITINDLHKELENKYTIDTILKAQNDCKIPEYYYLNEHREFCDQLGVKP